MKVTVQKWLAFVAVGAVIDALVYMGYMKLINNEPSRFTGGVILLISSSILGVIFFTFFYRKNDEK